MFSPVQIFVKVTEIVGDRVGADSTADGGRAKFLSYLNAIVYGQYTPERVGVRTSAELATIARSLDHIARGELPELADILVQRFNALECSVMDQSWQLAKGSELIPDPGAGLASTAERDDAARRERLYS